MKKLVQQLWNGEPVVVLGTLSVLAGALATAGVLPVAVAPVIAAIATVFQRGKVTPTKN